MTSLETIREVTKNLKKLCKSIGVNFTEKVYKDESLTSGSSIPVGHLYYKGEAFEHGYGAKAYYINAQFVVSVLLKDRNEAELLRQEQSKVHELREVLTVDGLNSGALETAKPVTRVMVQKVTINNDKSSNSAEVSFEITVRYREV